MSMKKRRHVISDTHFFHKNILDFESKARPFDSLADMHNFMIEQWNDAVERDDEVFVLGDVVFGKENMWILEMLHGKKKLIMGNHDIYNVNYLDFFEKVYGCLTIHKKDCKVILSHIPVHPNQFRDRFALNIHGHLHSAVIDDRRYVNVSCEHLPNLAPVDMDELIRSRLHELSKNSDRLGGEQP